MIGSASTFNCPTCCEEIREDDPIGKVEGEWVCQVCVDTYGEDES